MYVFCDCACVLAGGAAQADAGACAVHTVTVPCVSFGRGQNRRVWYIQNTVSVYMFRNWGGHFRTQTRVGGGGVVDTLPGPGGDFFCAAEAVLASKK